jgi:hypothetical protein
MCRELQIVILIIIYSSIGYAYYCGYCLGTWDCLTIIGILLIQIPSLDPIRKFLTIHFAYYWLLQHPPVVFVYYLILIHIRLWPPIYYLFFMEVVAYWVLNYNFSWLQYCDLIYTFIVIDVLIKLYCLPKFITYVFRTVTTLFFLLVVSYLWVGFYPDLLTPWLLWALTQPGYEVILSQLRSAVLLLYLLAILTTLLKYIIVSLW